MSHLQQDFDSIKTKITKQPFFNLKREEVSHFDLKEQLKKNPNVKVEIREFKDGFFEQVLSKFKGAAELIQKERFEQTKANRQRFFDVQEFIKNDVIFDNNEPLHPAIESQLLNLKSKAIFQNDTAFFVLVPVDKSALYLAEQLKENQKDFQLINNEKQRQELNNSTKHAQKIICSKAWAKVILKDLKVNHPLTPVLIVNNKHKSFFSTGKLFDTIEGQYIGQSTKIQKLLDFAEKHPQLAKKYMNRILLNSGMNSGKSFSMFKQFVPVIKKIYSKEVFTIVISPRLLLLEQTAEEEKDFVYYSSAESATSAHKFNPKEVKNILTTFQSANKIIQRIQSHYTSPEIVLFVDEAHILMDSSFMGLQELIGLIMDGSISKTIGLTATPYRQFEYDWEVLRLDRSIKPQRNAKIVYVYGEGQKEARFASMNYLVSYIKAKNYKTTANFIKGRDEVRTLTELMNIDLAEELKETGGKAYALSGTSSKKEIEENAFRTSIIEEQSPLLGSHFNATKIADVGINMKRKQGEAKNCLELSSYIAESDYDFVDVTTFLQSMSRDRDFEEKEILLIIPVNTNKKDGATYEFDFDKELHKAELLKEHLNTNYKFYKQNYENLEVNPLTSTKSQYSNLSSTDKRMRFLSFNENSECWEIYRYKLYERQIEFESKRLSKQEVLSIMKTFFDVEIEFLPHERSIDGKKAEDLAESLKLKKEKALNKVWETLKTKNHVHALASILYYQSMNQEDRTKLFLNFVITNQNEDLFNKDLRDAYVYFRTNLLEEILLIKDDLLDSLYSYASIFKKTNFEYFDEVKYIAFKQGAYKRKQTLDRLELFLYMQFRNSNSLSESFSFVKGVKDIAKIGISDTEYKYMKLMIDSVNDFANGETRIETIKLLWHLQKVDAKLPKGLYRGGFESTNKMIHFLRKYFDIKTGVRMYNSHKKGIEILGVFDSVKCILGNSLKSVPYQQFLIWK